MKKLQGLMSLHTNYSLVITDPALDDLEAIANFTVNQWGEAQAIVYKNALYSALLDIQAKPEQGRPRYGVSEHYKGWSSGRHVIFYRVKGSTIYVIRVLHDSMDFPRHLT